MISNNIFSLIKVELLSFCVCVRVCVHVCLIISLLLFGIFFSVFCEENVLLILIWQFIILEGEWSSNMYFFF